MKGIGSNAVHGLVVYSKIDSPGPTLKEDKADEDEDAEAADVAAEVVAAVPTELEVVVARLSMPNSTELEVNTHNYSPSNSLPHPNLFSCTEYGLFQGNS